MSRLVNAILLTASLGITLFALFAFFSWVSFVVNTINPNQAIRLSEHIAEMFKGFLSIFLVFSPITMIAGFFSNGFDRR